MTEQHWTLEDAARAIAERFIKNCTGMPVRRVEIHVGGDTQLLGRLEQEAIVWRLGQEYFPRFRALDYVDSQLRNYAERCTEMVLKALQWLYRTDDSSTSFSFQAIRSAVKSTVDVTAEDEMVLLGMLLARDFLNLIGNWNGTLGSTEASLIPRPEILGFDNMGTAWKRELERRSVEAPPQVLKAVGATVLPTRPKNRRLVFLSHAASDQQIASALKTTIETAIPGSDVFVSSDGEDLRPGDAWVETIQGKLQEASLLIILSTQRGLNRRWVWYETGAGWISGLRMIPCCVGSLRKGQLVPPFYGLQALNGDDETDLRLLLKVAASELGLVVNEIPLSGVIAQLKELDRKASLLEPSVLSLEERRLRVHAIALTAYIEQGDSQLFILRLTNRSDEIVTVREIRLETLEGILLANPAEPEKKDQWRIESQGRCIAEWKPTRSPAGELTSVERRKRPVAAHFETEISVNVHCESLAIPIWKKCPPVRVQVDVSNHRIVQIGI